MDEGLTPFQQTNFSLSKKIACIKSKLEKAKIHRLIEELKGELKEAEAKKEFLEIGYNQRKEETEEQKVIFQEDQPKPVHIKVIALSDESTNTSFYFGGATVGQLSMINHEIDLLKREVLDRIGEAPKEWEIEETSEDP